MEVSHRDKKKQQQRRAIIDSAQKLFLQKGYQTTSIADIARLANCAPRTFFQYFSSKEDLLLVEVDAMWESLQASLARRGDTVSTLQVLKVWMNEVMQAFNDGNTSVPTLNETSSSYLSAKARQELYSMDRLEVILAPELAKDLQEDASALKPRLIATMAAAVFNTLHRQQEFIEGDKQAYADQALALLEKVIDAHPKASVTATARTA